MLMDIVGFILSLLIAVIVGAYMLFLDYLWVAIPAALILGGLLQKRDEYRARHRESSL